MGTGVRWAAAACLGLLVAGCGKDFGGAQSAGDLRALPANQDELRIRGLPDSAVDLLARFRDARILDFGGGSNVLDLRMTAAGFSRLADLALPRVTIIGLQNCPALDDESLRHVARIRTVRTVLLNDSTGFSGEGLAHVLRLPELEYLDLRGCTQVANSWVDALGGCKTLKQLGVTRTGITAGPLRDLRAALPGCFVDDDIARIDVVLDRKGR